MRPNGPKRNPSIKQMVVLGRERASARHTSNVEFSGQVSVDAPRYYLIVIQAVTSLVRRNINSCRSDSKSITTRAAFNLFRYVRYQTLLSAERMQGGGPARQQANK